MNPENVQRSKFILSQYIEKVEISNEKIKATFKVAFSNSGEESVVAEYKEEKSINRKLLLKNYSDIDKSSDIYRIIENLKARHE